MVSSTISVTPMLPPIKEPVTAAVSLLQAEDSFIVAPLYSLRITRNP